jgi:hypothetical protein
VNFDILFVSIFLMVLTAFGSAVGVVRSANKEVRRAKYELEREREIRQEVEADRQGLLFGIKEAIRALVFPYDARRDEVLETLKRLDRKIRPLKP